MNETIIKALQESGKLVMKHFGKIQPFQIKEYNASIVTEVDLASENLIISIISSDFPEHNIVAEETGFRDHNSSYTWVVDPIDGTSNFAVGLPWFGILICLMKDYEPILSGVYLPFYNKMFLAEKNRGATCNQKKIKCSIEKELGNVLIAYSLDFSNNSGKLDQEMKLMREFVKYSRNLRATNSVLDMCYTAEGRLGASMNQTSKIWDIAAPYLIAKEAGAVVTDFFNRPLDFHFDASTYLKNFDFLIANTHIHSRLCELIHEANSL